MVNHTNRYTNSAIRVYIVGVNPATGAQCHVSAEGTLHPVSLSDNGPDGFTDYSIPLAGDGDTTLPLPHLSGRIYLALDEPLKFRAVLDGNGRPALQYPAGWVTSDPNYPVLHDCIEFSFNDTGMYCNTTMVDMFSVPLALSLRGSSQQTTGTLSDGGRDAILSALAGQDPFAPLVVPGLRVIAPGHGIESGLFPADYYDSYVDNIWSTYTGRQLRVHTGGATYSGQVSGDTLSFDGGVAPFQRPSTRDIFFCNGALSAPNDGRTGPVAAVLGAGFNRSTLLTDADQPGNDPANFYRDAVTNHYSRVIHANTVDGRAYGFPFDDVAGFASYIQDNAPSALTVTLAPF